MQDNSSTPGVRKDRAGSALARKLTAVAKHVVITMHDCGTEWGVPKTPLHPGEKWERPLADAIRGRISLHAITTATGEPIVQANEMITPEQARQIGQSGPGKVLVRSPMTCQAPRGVCRLCYGIDLATGALVNEGVAVGLLAAEAIAAASSRLPRHNAKPQTTTPDNLGLPRVMGLFEAWRPRDPAVMAEVSGRVRLGEKKRGKRIIWVQPVDDAGDPLGEEFEHRAPHGAPLRVHTGDYVRAGDPLVLGVVSPHDVLRIAGTEAVQAFLVSELQVVYRAHRVDVDDRHLEIIVAQMLRKVKVEVSGDTALTPGTLIDKFAFYELNARLKGCVKIQDSGASRWEAGEIVSKEAFEAEYHTLKETGIAPPTGVAPTPGLRSVQLLGITKAAWRRAAPAD